MNQLQQDFEAYFKRDMDFQGEINYSWIEAKIGLAYWEAAHNKYSQDNQKYIDLLKDIYYNYDLPSGVDQKIEKLLGDLL
jgi:hypothetical protein